MTEQADRRGEARLPIELRVDYRKLNTFFADYTRNISRGGTFIATDRPLPPGTRFRFRLAIPGFDPPFELEGEVSWARAEGEGRGMGIRFLYGDDATRRAFEEAVEGLMAERLGPQVAARLLGR